METTAQPFEATVAAIDAVLLKVIRSNESSSGEKIRAIALFYRRHQAGGFARPKPRQVEKQAPAISPPEPPPAKTAERPSPQPVVTDSGVFSSPPPPLLSVSPTSHLQAVRKTTAPPDHQRAAQRRR